MEDALARRLTAELVGTAILVLFGAGSVVAALKLGEGKLDYAGLGMIAITFALAVALAIYAFGTTSGAHINPAVTVSLAAVRRFPAGGVLPQPLLMRPRAVEVEPAQGAQDDIEGHRDRAVEPAAESGPQGTSGDIAGRRL